MEEQKQIRIVIPDEAYAELHDAALADLSNGGRGIGNQVESLLINPLARWLFDMEVSGNRTVTIEHFLTKANPAAVVCHLDPEEEAEKHG